MTPQVTSDLLDVRQRIQNLLAANDLAALRIFLTEQHPADIADMLEGLDDAERVVIFDSLHIEMAAEVLDETLTEVTRDLVEAISDEKIADMLETMPMDDAAEILSEINDARAAEILVLMKPEEAAEVGALLAHPDESAGRLMTADVVRIDEAWTIEETLQYLRGVDPDVETLAYLYVVNGGEQLCGVLPIWDLLTAAPDRRIEDLMNPDVISVAVDTDQEEVARIVAQYDFFAVPVIDQEGKLRGIITHDDVIDILEEEFTEDVQRFGGSVPLEHTYLSTSIWMMVRKRIGWLLILFLTATLTGTVMRLFEGTLARAVTLSFFIPLLIGTGGNAGSQMTATMIRALAVGEVHFEDLGKVLVRETITGLILGVVMGLAGLGRALTWHTGLQVGLTVAISLAVLVVWSNVMGMLLPMIADKMKVDPTVISGPVMSTLVDATGLLIYFTVAGWMITGV